MYAIIVGTGTVMTGLANRLSEAGHQLAFVIDHIETAERIADRFPRALVIRGSGSDEVALSHARAGECDAFFALGEDDTHNMVACLLAKERFKIPHIVALASACEDTPAFSALSIDCVCGPDVVIDALLAHA